MRHWPSQGTAWDSDDSDTDSSMGGTKSKRLTRGKRHSPYLITRNVKAATIPKLQEVKCFQLPFLLDVPWQKDADVYMKLNESMACTASSCVPSV